MDPKKQIFRDENGVAHIEANTEEELFYLFGYAHATDRGLQMISMRVIGQGRLCELFEDSETSLKVDLFFRKMNWAKNDNSNTSLTPESELLFNAYSRGINDAFSVKLPGELKLLPYAHEEWTLDDTILLSRMVGYVSLSQGEGEIEKLFIEMVQAGIADDKLEELFSKESLKGFDRKLAENISLAERMVPDTSSWFRSTPAFTASNSWVLSGKKTKSGKPILANDPHLSTNRLPAIWFEISFSLGDFFAIGATMPGLPGLLIGRSSYIAWGVTYSYMDTVDSWIENCKEGAYYRENEGWVPFKKRKEVIKRKKHKDEQVTFFENQHGTLEGDPYNKGMYLSTRWSGAKSGINSINALMEGLKAKNVKEGMHCLGRVESTWSWVLADSEGNIGFQMSGLMPKRAAGLSGFFPVPGWIEENDWQGYIPYTDLPKKLNPEEGFFVTANNDLNSYGKAKPINHAMGPYRAKRIADLLTEKSKYSVKDMFSIQLDLYSIQAEEFMKILTPLLPDTRNGRILKEWDLKYSLDSKGAYLFEKFHETLFYNIFGDNGFGRDTIRHLRTETSIIIGFFHRFDKIMLSESSAWFGGKTRAELFREAAEKSLSKPAKTLKALQKFQMTHILLGETPFKFLGINRGPYYLKGGRSTIQQGQIYKSASRINTFAPSYRIITDFAEEICHTNLAGGPSEHILSRWYDTDIKNWLSGRYKKVEPKRGRKQIRFP